MQGVKEWEEKNCEGKPSVGWVGGEQGLSRYLCQRGSPQVGIGGGKAAISRHQTRAYS